MGVSTDAILFYGYCWTEEDCSDPSRIGHEDEDDEYDGDWEEKYAALKGCPKPEGPYNEKRYGAYLDKRGKLLEEEPCEIATHCSGECPMPYVAISNSVVRAWRGDPRKIETPLKVPPAWNDQLAEFCRFMKIDVGEQKPAWWLVSDWN